jgi:hypothetical protein
MPHLDPSPARRATPVPPATGRDLSIDLLRAACIAAVAIGHWLVVVPTYDDGRFSGTNALGEVWLLQPLSWLFQVMPLFFVLGGAAHAHSWTRAHAKGTGAATWAAARLGRLLRPAAALLVATGGLVALLTAAGVDADAREQIGWVLLFPLWFLAVYVGVVVAAPLLVAADERWGWRGPAALCGATLALDVVRVTDPTTPLRWASFATVFVACHQVGLRWVAGALDRSRARVLVVGGAVVLAAAVAGPYHLAMVGVPGDELANNAPPTSCLLALGLAAVTASAGVARVATGGVAGDGPLGLDLVVLGLVLVPAMPFIRAARAGGSASEVDPEDGLELGERDGGVDHLDGPHAHGPRRLQVDTQVVEEHGLGRLDVEALACTRVEGGVGLADPDLRRLDHDVEAGEDGVDGGVPRPGVIARSGPGGAVADDAEARDVVGEQAQQQPRLVDDLDGAGHLGAEVTGEQRQHGAPVELEPERRGLPIEGVDEAVDVDLAALEAGPRVGVGVRRVDGADGVRWQPEVGLVAGEGLERRREDDPAEVEQDGPDPGRSTHRSVPSRSVATASHRRVDSSSESTSTRSSSPWNITP